VPTHGAALRCHGGVNALNAKGPILNCPVLRMRAPTAALTKK
jgi:hypothetical protein